MTTTSSRTLSSFDPQFLKLLAHHQHFQHQSRVKDFLPHTFYYNHPPPNTIATSLPRHLLGNGLSKLNTDNTSSHLRIDSSQTLREFQVKKSSKESLNYDQWLQPPVGSIIQGPPCLQADTSLTASKTETILSSGIEFIS